jgi:hypothetical protein
MSAKIYVLQKALFHASSVADLEKLAQTATQVIREGGGAIQEISEVQSVDDGPDKGSFCRFIDYYLLKTSLDDLELMAQALQKT